MDTLLKYINTALSIRRKQPTTEKEKTAPLFKEPYIDTSYRLPYKPLKYYLYSMFQIHNETVNVWTHFMAFLIFLYNLQKFGSNMNIMDEPLSWGYLAFSTGAISYAISSTIAHLYHSQSEWAHYICYQFDYMGIGLGCFGTAAGLYFFAGNEAFYQSFIGHIFLFSYTFIASLVCVFLSYGKMKFSKPYPITKKYIALGTMTFAFLYACIPLCYTFYDSLCHKDWSHFWTLVYPHLQYIFYFLLSGFFFASRVPERFFPGKCDILVHGHQIFHVLMGFCSCVQYSNLYMIYKNRPKRLVQLSNPGLHNTLIPVLAIVILDLLFMYFLRGYTYRRATEEHSKADQWIKTKTR